MDVPEHIEASRSVFGTAREGAALDGEVPVPLSSTLEAPAVSFERRTNEVEREGIEEEPGGGNNSELLRSGAVLEGVLYRGE